MVSGGQRSMLRFGGLPGVVLSVGDGLLPETPRWLAGHGHAAQAEAKLLQLRAAAVMTKGP